MTTTSSIRTTLTFAHAAILGKAHAIVTDDRRAGFKTSAKLIAANIEIVSPAEFAANTVAAHPAAGARSVRSMSRRMKQPAMSQLEVLKDLRTRYQMTEVFDLLAPRLS